MSLNYSDKVIDTFRCQKKRVITSQKVVKLTQAENTWFVGAYALIEKILILTYALSHQFTYDQAINECNLTDEDTKVSRETVADWCGYCREMTVIDR